MGAHFTCCSLKSLRLTVQLNHISMHCTNSIHCCTDMHILYYNGIHDVAIQYCECERSLPNHIQLLCCGFYPVSHKKTQTCATFQLLEQFHLLILTSKASMYNMYRMLEKATDSTDDPPKSRYRALMRMSLQWRHLKMLKRGGQAHDSEGINATEEDTLAIECPSYPRSGINLPEDWKSASASLQYLYDFTACIDANFHLKN